MSPGEGIPLLTVASSGILGLTEVLEPKWTTNDHELAKEIKSRTAEKWGTWVAHVMIPGSNQAPHHDPCSVGSLLLPVPLPAIPHACALLSLIKPFKK